jgi:hypothetical protein
LRLASSVGDDNCDGSDAFIHKNIKV